MQTADLIISIDIDFSSTGIKLLKDIESSAETHLLRGDSHHDEIRQRVEAILDRRWIDLLYIDGDHSYEGVLTELEMYSALVRNGGAVMMDDIDNTTSAPGSA